MASECPVCGADDPTVSVNINNSESSVFSGRGVKGICEKDVVFDVEFEEDYTVSMTICESCYNNNRHLTDEYVEEFL